MLLAAGAGRRFAGKTPKQHLPLGGQSVVECALDRMLALDGLSGMVVAVARDDHRWRRVAGRYPGVLSTVGGRRRVDSARRALAALDGRAADDDWALVHDAARPCIMPALARRLLDAVRDHPVGGMLALPVDETVKRADASGAVLGTERRAGLWRAQTPQAFRVGMLREALQVSAAAERAGDAPASTDESEASPTDESSAIERLGHRPLLVPGSAENIKITRLGDLALAEAVWSLQQQRLCA